jgi:endonuclease/exonuclease/phosphatase family metal-dependent hydrolase
VIFGGDLNFWNVWKNYGDASTRKPYEALLNGQLTLASNVSGVETNFWTSTQKENYTQSYQGFSKFDESKKIFDPSQTTLTYANKNPYTLDHVFVGNTSSMTLHRHYIIVDELTRRASDHSPVIVDFTVK